MKACLLLAFLAFPAAALSCDERALELERRAHLLESGEFVRVASQLVSDCPANARARNLLATALESSGDLSGAASQYQEAERLDPKWAYPHLGLGDIAAARKDFETAKEQYLQASRLAANPGERSDAARSLESLPGSSRSYSFKSAGSIEKLLDIGHDHRGRRGASVRIPSPSLDSFVSESGIAVNFTIEFDFDSAAVRPSAIPQLIELAAALKKAAAKERYVIEGHSSSEGDLAHNTRLSLERAKSVLAYLAAGGVNPAILSPRGAGPSRLVLESGVENKEKSRRVTLFRPF